MARRAWVYVGRRAGKKPSPSEKLADHRCLRGLHRGSAEAAGSFPRSGRLHNSIIRSTSSGSGTATNTGSLRATAPKRRRRYKPEFDAPFARLEYVSRDCFDVSYHRHTGEWLCIFERLSLTEALEMFEGNSFFAPC